METIDRTTNFSIVVEIPSLVSLSFSFSRERIAIRESAGSAHNIYERRECEPLKGSEANEREEEGGETKKDKKRRKRERERERGGTRT